MKKSILILAAALFVAGSILSNANAVAKVAQPEAMKDSISEFQKFKNGANSEINKMEKSFEKFREDMRKEKEDVRAKSKEQIDALDRKNHELKVKLEGYSDDAKSDWKSFKKEFRHDMDEIGQAFKDLTKKNTK